MMRTAVDPLMYSLSLSALLDMSTSDSAFYRYGTRNGFSIFRIVLTPVVLCTVYSSHSAEITALIQGSSESTNKHGGLIIHIYF